MNSPFRTFPARPVCRASPRRPSGSSSRISTDRSQTPVHIRAEAVHKAQDVIGDRKIWVLDQTRKIHGEGKRRFLVGAVRGKISSVPQAAARGGQIVALAAGDLRIENSH